MSSIKLPKFILPKLHDSPDKRGCSPQGFVALICPISGVVLSSFILSNQTIPGSPFNHAPSIIIEKISLALTYSPSFFGVEYDFLSRGHASFIYLSSLTDFIKLASAPTEILKLLISPSVVLQVIKSLILG